MGKTLRRQLVTIVLTVTVPLALLLVVNNLYSVNLYNRKIAESNRRMVSLNIEMIEEELSAIDQSLMSLIAGNSDFILLSGGSSGLQAHLSSYALIERLKNIMPAYPMAGAFFLYSVPSSVERDLFSENFTYAQKIGIRNFIRECVRSDSITYDMNWRYAKVDGNYYLFRFFGGRQTYLAAMVPLSGLAGTERLQIEGDTTVAAFVTEDIRPLTQTDYIEAHGIDLTGDYDRYFFSGSPSHMVLGGKIENTNCGMVILVGGAGYFGFLNPIQRSLLIASFLSLIMIPLLLLWLDKSVLRPLNAVKDAMRRIREGNLEAQVSADFPVREFRQMGETFNTMIAQIKDLKIEAYEKELEAQKTELRLLHLQIRPHFFLNCLKSIYALTRQRQYDEQQRMILSLSKHISYIFRNNVEYVPLRNELEHVRNYMDIQAISSQLKPVLRIQIAPELEDFQIPPLSLQTFVENCVKHGSSPDKALEIDIRASLLEGDQNDAYANLMVGDNGPGFSEEALREINQDGDSAFYQTHIGIYNVRRRLRITFGPDATFIFYNNGIGAVSEVFLPLKKVESGKWKMES